jgi:hypothetical protein
MSIHSVWEIAGALKLTFARKIFVQGGEEVLAMLPIRDKGKRIDIVAVRKDSDNEEYIS